MENLNSKHFYIRDKLIKYSKSTRKRNQCYNFTLEISHNTLYNKDIHVIPDFLFFK